MENNHGKRCLFSEIKCFLRGTASNNNWLFLLMSLIFLLLRNHYDYFIDSFETTTFDFPLLSYFPNFLIVVYVVVKIFCWRFCDLDIFHFSLKFYQCFISFINGSWCHQYSAHMNFFRFKFGFRFNLVTRLCLNFDEILYQIWMYRVSKMNYYT